MQPSGNKANPLDGEGFSRKTTHTTYLCSGWGNKKTHKLVSVQQES